MTPAFPARRRAEQFDSLVEDTSTSGRTDARYDDFLEIVGTLRQTPRIEARPQFVADLRDRLLGEADSVLRVSPRRTVDDRLALPLRRPARERRLATAIGGLAIVGATSSMAMAAQTALPGEALYPLKRAIENAHTGFSVGEGQRGTTLLANATGRLEEVEALSRDGSDDPETIADTIAETLGSFTEQATEASDLLIADYETTGQESSIAELRSFTADSMAVLETLAPVVPDDARDALVTAAQVLTQIDAEAATLCPSCPGGLTEIPSFATQAADAFRAGVYAGPAPARATPARHGNDTQDTGDGRGGRGDRSGADDGGDDGSGDVGGGDVDPSGATGSHDPLDPSVTEGPKAAGGSGGATGNETGDGGTTQDPSGAEVPVTVGSTSPVDVLVGGVTHGVQQPAAGGGGGTAQDTTGQQTGPDADEDAGDALEDIVDDDVTSPLLGTPAP